MRTIGVVLVTLGWLIGAPTARAAEPGPAAYRVVIEDPRNDDDGPGRYVYPSSPPYNQAGLFDLRRFEVRRERDELVFELSFDSPLRRPTAPRTTSAVELELDNGVYAQNIDIYLDKAPGKGWREAVPGRNVLFEDGAEWDVCVVLTPQPYAVRSVLDGWKPGRDVLVPVGVRARGRTVVARIPIAQLGEPDPSWGWQVMVTGALWENNFQAMDWLLDESITNAFTMPVRTVAEPMAFGGGELTRFHPWVIDLIAPPGRTQAGILGRANAEAKRVAMVPMVYPNPEARAKLEMTQSATEKAAPTVAAELKLGVVTPPNPLPVGDVQWAVVRDVREKLVVLVPEGDAIALYKLGDVLDRKGQIVARVVISQVYSEFVVATLVQGQDGVEPGARVRFQRSKE